MSQFAVLLVLIITCFLTVSGFKLFLQRNVQDDSVKFYIFSRRYSSEGKEVFIDNVKSVNESSFNHLLPTKVLIHGFNGTKNSIVNQRLKEAYLDKGDFNIIVCTWSKYRRLMSYIFEKWRVPNVGEVLAKFLDFMHEKSSLNFNQTTIIGFSMGAHIAGVAGKHIKHGKIKSIVGLDPSGILFYEKRSDNRLDLTDAKYVEVIHTNTKTMGFKETLGHADFYINGGEVQPHCQFSHLVNSTMRFLKNVMVDVCSHRYALEYYIQTFNQQKFEVIPCESLDDLKVACNKTEKARSLSNKIGIFYVKT